MTEQILRWKACLFPGPLSRTSCCCTTRDYPQQSNSNWWHPGAQSFAAASHGKVLGERHPGGGGEGSLAHTRHAFTFKSTSC